MPKTLKQTIDRAAAKAKVKASGIDLTPEDYSNFTSELNSMMFELDASGIQLGWVEVLELDEFISTSMWADLFVQNSLALHMIEEYGIPMPQGLVAAFDRSERTIEKNTVDSPVVRFPSFMPTGAKGPYRSTSYNFYYDNTPSSIQDNLGVQLTDSENDPINDA